MLLDVVKHVAPVFRRHVKVKIAIVELRSSDLLCLTTLETFKRELKQLSSNLHTDDTIARATASTVHRVIFVVHVTYGVEPRHRRKFGQ